MNKRSGFTLIELMVSVALALILIAGVSQVFKITSDTIGTTEALGAAIRQDRATQQVLVDDTRAAVANQPCIILDSNRIFAFRNRNDEAGDKDGNSSTWDPTASGTEAAQDTVIYGQRNHRVDIFSFFASDLFRRQTGNDGVYASTLTSNEAWINYGHLNIMRRGGDPRTQADFYSPGNTNAANVDNRYASQFVLGRVQMLLSENPPATEACYHRASPWSPAPPDSVANASNLSPLWNSTSGDNGYSIVDHRYDLAATSITTFRQMIDAYQHHTSPINDSAPAYPNANWWGPMTYRFNCNPFPSRPVDSAKMAQAAPMFVAGCSQFIVEFAGDFVAQNEDGSIIPPPGPNMPFPRDGKIDFIAEKVASGPNRYSKTTRWYGLPRDTGSRMYDPATGNLTASSGRPDGIIDSFDVVPVRDIRGGQSMFEKFTPPQSSNYANIPAAQCEYFCAFGPIDIAAGDVPKMIRITLTIDDAAGRLADGQTYEYVLKLGL